MLDPYQQYYQQILTDPSIPSLLQFPFQDHTQPPYPSQKQLFPICNQHDTPDFFKTNLLSPNRIIKYLSGEYCVYKAFYFQLFKLMFEIQNEEKDYLEMFKQIVFDPDIIQRNGENSRAKRENSRLKTNNNQVKTNNNQQQNQSVSNSRLSQMSQQQAFRKQFQTHQKCIALFTQKILQNKLSFSSFQHYLPYYPQIDQSITLILQTFIQNANSSQSHQMDSIQSILQYLCEIFEIQLVVIENCFKFEESDVFLYIEQKEQDEEVWVYVAFNQLGDQEEEEEEEEEDQNQGEEGNQYRDSGSYLNNQPSNISSSNQQTNNTNNYPQPHSSSSYQLQQPHSSPHHSYPQNPHNPSYTSSSNQNPSHKDNQSLTHKNKQSFSYRENVITSQMKAQQSSHNKYFNHYSPNNNFISQKSPHEFDAKDYDNKDNRPNRISSDKGLSHHDIIKPQTQNPLTKSNHLPSNHQNSYTKYQDLPNNTSTSFIWNQNQQQQRSTHQLPSALSQSNGFLDNSKKQRGNFQKKVRYFDQDSIIELSVPSNKQLTKMQSITQAYRQDTFHKQPQKDQGSFIKKNQHQVIFISNQQSSFYVIQNSHLRNTSDKKVTDSKAQTIINMFGDMLGSVANIDTFDNVHGSSSSITNGFVSSSNHKMQPQKDHGNNLYREAYSKKYAYAYGMLNNIGVNEQVRREANNVNMKKIKSEQVIFEARPKEGGDVFSNVEIREKINARNEYVPNKSSFMQQADRRSNNNQQQTDKLLMDSQELRTNNNNGNAQLINNNEYYPFKNISSLQQAQKSSPKNSDNQYLDNIQAKSYWGQQQKTNRNKSNPGSFHNSSRGSTKSHHLQHPVELPNIKVNSIKSESQSSSKELNRRNNYYREEDFNLVEGFSRQQYRGGGNDKDTSIKSEDNFNSHYQENYKQTSRQQPPKVSHISSFTHQYKSQQYVRVPPTQQTSNNSKQNPHLSRAYTSNPSSNHPPKTLQAQNTQQQDDFFFHPSNKSSLRYGLKTIEQVRASKQINKDSYKIGNVSKISQNNDRGVEVGEEKLHKYELVNSITGMVQEVVGGKQMGGQSKGVNVVNKLLDTNSYKFKETKQQQSNKELNDESVNNGTFYKQFTNSKVLKLLKQPYKTKVQILKNRFKGQHRISINKVIT